MKAKGIVTKTENGFATVVSQRSSACSSCHNCEAKGACHAELVFGSQTEDVFVEAYNDVGAKRGDRVELESSTKETLLASFAFFVIPFMITIIFFFAFKNQFSAYESFPLILIAVFAVSFIIIGKILNTIFSKKKTIRIVAILEECKEHLEAE